jgi:hypothetical protein
VQTCAFRASVSESKLPYDLRGNVKLTTGALNVLQIGQLRGRDFRRVPLKEIGNDS